jgi:multidrug efflux pump subunit AcrB
VRHPAAADPQLRRLIHDVFTNGYITAMRPTLAISVAILLAGTAACLLLRRAGAPATGVPATPAAGQAPGATQTEPASTR